MQHGPHVASSASTTDLPTTVIAEQSLRHAQDTFRRTLANWASDVLLLRRGGMLQPTWPAPSAEAPLYVAA